MPYDATTLTAEREREIERERERDRERKERMIAVAVALGNFVLAHQVWRTICLRKKNVYDGQGSRKRTGWPKALRLKC
jgi:hypothetical protein